MPVHSGAGCLSSARFPPEPGRTRAGGIYVVVFGDPLREHNRARRAAQNRGKVFSAFLSSRSENAQRGSGHVL